MKFASKFLLTFLLLVFFAGNSCRKDILEHNASTYAEPNEALDRGAGKGETKLGSKLNNPYALSVIKQAYYNVYHVSAASLQPTHLYVRFLPSTPEKLALLDIENGEYWNFPLDYKIDYMGDTYHDPSISDTTYTWLYTVVPAGYQFPSVTYEILEQLVYVPDETQLLKEAYALTSNTWYEPDVYLGAPTFNNGVIAYASPNGGGGGGGFPTGGGGGSSTPSTECGCPLPDNVRKPSGCVTVFDTQHNQFEPVRHVQVITAKDDLGLFFVNRAETSDGGCFSISHKYHGKIHIWIRFESAYCDIKTMSGVGDLDGYAFTRKGYKGTFGGPNFNNLAIRFSNNPDLTNADHLNWVAATANNGLHEYRDWCIGNGVNTPIANLKILITPFANGSGATVMLNKMASFTNTMAQLGGMAVADIVGWLPAGPAMAVLGNMLIGYLAVSAPDVVLNFSNGAVASDVFKEVVYHESGHVSHWGIVSNSYWQDNIFYIGSVLLHQFSANPYGDGTLSSAGRCAVIEAWGNHTGETVSESYYGKQSSPYRLQRNGPQFISSGTMSSYIIALENFDPNLIADPFRWIPVGIFNDLIDNASEAAPVSDPVNGGFTEAQLFNCLDVTSVGALKTKVQAIAGNTQQTQVNALFAAYGY